MRPMKSMRTLVRTTTSPQLSSMSRDRVTDQVVRLSVGILGKHCLKILYHVLYLQ